MKALLLEEYKQLALVDLPTPEIGPNDLLVRVKACGICGSDVHGYDGSSGRRIPPIVMGHEAAGTIEKTGSEVTMFKAGDRITFDSTVYCGECQFCKNEQFNLCDNRRVLGVSCDEYRQYGAFAEYVVIPERIAYLLPDNLPYEHAAMIEAVSVAVHAVNRSNLKSDQTAIVVGTGMIGLLVVQAVRAAGCESVIAVDLDDDKLNLAIDLGATHKVNAGDSDHVQQILNLTGNVGAHVAFEVVGATSPINTAINGVRKGGSVVLVGNLAPEINLPLQSVVTRELTLYGTCASSGEYPQCIDLMASGKINVAPLISQVASLDEGADYFNRLYSGEKGLMKVILTP